MAAVQYYVHPLALESQNFLKSLESYGQKYNQIDPTLCDMLRDVVFGIEKFLKQNPQQIVASEKIKLVQPKEFPTVLSIYHCTTCNKDLGKSADVAALHLAQQHRLKTPRALAKAEKKQAEQKRLETKVVKLPKKAKAVVMSDMGTFFAEQLQVAEKLKQIPEYDIIEDTLSTMLKQVFPDKSIKLYKFGSRITGIGTRNSDLDIYVDVGDRFNIFEPNVTPATYKIFDRTLEMVKKCTTDWGHIRPIRGARVPIIRMTNKKTNIECDVGFSNGLSYFNTQLLQYVFQQQPIARRICLFMKKWLERTHLNERITTYCMALMVIYYLQLKRALPSLEELQAKVVTHVKVGPWIGNFIEVPLANLNMQEIDVSPSSCKQQIKEFCQFYAKFNYDTQLVCPYIGRANILTNDFDVVMPDRYIHYARLEVPLLFTSPMVVQDPIQLSHNVAARVTKHDLKEWKDYLAQSANILAELK